ncbi:multicopper polyphenol oxidase [Clostridiales bacterium PH28_bin88]|nr:multicopper polyphenol oxidase [Clostridiales bacterium PH28_bin88]
MSNGFVLRRGKGELHYLSIPVFEQQGPVVCAFSTRLGGVSPAPYDSLNLAFHVGDRPDNVRANRSSFFSGLGIDPLAIVAGHQVHGEQVAQVSDRHKGRGAADWETVLPGTDAMVTDSPGIPLTTYYADCVPVFLLDPVNRAIGVAHAGWKGTVLEVGRKTLEQMSRLFGTDPARCLAAVGPSIGPCCYEVDQAVAGPLRERISFGEELLLPRPNGRWRLNLWEANARSLQEAGVTREHITVSELCTSCRTDLFFSHRAEGGVTGRMAAVLMLLK